MKRARTTRPLLVPTGELVAGDADHAIVEDEQVMVGGSSLELAFSDPVVARGSQFPTQWGKGGRARYVGALLRRGDVPWAVEIKVPKSGGPGNYYRHGLGQAVLYREYIRAATQVHPWFSEAGMDATKCQAALVFPLTKNAPKVEAVAALGELRGVAVDDGAS